MVFGADWSQDLTKQEVILCQELIVFLKDYEYIVENRGKTSGSAICFYNEKTKRKIMIHRPHPGNIIKKYCIIIKYSIIYKGDDKESV